MHNKMGAFLLISTIILAGGGAIFAPAALAMVAGSNTISTLLASATKTWLEEQNCRTVKAEINGIAGAYLFIGGSSFTFLLPFIVIGTNQLYRHSIKKWPQCEGLPYNTENTNRLFACCYKLIPGREVLITFASFLLSAVGFALTAVEIVVTAYSGMLNKGFNKDLYACPNSEDIPDSINQNIKDVAKPVAAAARATGYSMTFLLVPAISVLVLLAAKVIGFRREQQAGERQRLLVNARKRANEEGINYYTGF